MKARKRRSLPFGRCLGASLLAFTFSGEAFAGEPQASFEPAPSGIIGGQAADVCQFPSTAGIFAGNSACTAVLVHPQLVVFAAHCSANQTEVMFGESLFSPARTVAIERCAINPGYIATNGQLGEGTDLGYCRLAEPVEDIPIVPILAACENDIVVPGRPIVSVGFGRTENNSSGDKRWVDGEIMFVDGGPNGITTTNELWVGTTTTGTCQGDSGGPTFVQLDDGSWRVLGITSWGIQNGCGQGGSIVRVEPTAAWIEDSSGIDLTPCSTPDGTWQPTPACTGFDLEPLIAAGTWANGCSGSPLSGPVDSCGPAAPDEDLELPTVALTQPAMDIRIDPEPGSSTAQLQLIAEAMDVGFGVELVELRVNGAPFEGAQDYAAAYDWSLSLPPGQYAFDARAVDFGGNEGFSQVVYVGVGEEPMPPVDPTTTGDDSAGESDSGAEVSTGDASSGEVGTGSGADGEAGSGSSGCGCSAPEEDSPWGLFAFVPLLLRRRRR